MVEHVCTLHLRACDHTKFNLNFPQPSDEFQGRSQVHGHSSWPYCKAALRCEVLCTPCRGLITGNAPTSVESPRTALPAASGSENTSASVLEMEVEEVEYHVISQVTKSDWIEPAPLDVTSISRSSEVGGKSAMLEAFHQFQHNPQVQVCTGFDAF